MPFTIGDPVVVRRLGKGVVREVRRRGQYLVALGTTMIVCDEQDLTIVVATGKKTRAREPRRATATRRDGFSAAGPRETERAAGRTTTPTLDLHGLTVEEALQRVDERLNAAMLAGAAMLEIIHGKGSGRIRAALHHHLRAIASVRRFEVDPRNAGVTHVYL